MEKIDEIRPKSVMKGVDRMSYRFVEIPDDIEKIVTIYYEDKSDYNKVIDKKDPFPLIGYKKLVEGSPVIMVRCDIECTGINPNECFQMIYNFDIRKSWDKALSAIVIEKIDDFTDYIYSVFKAPWGASNRDFCQFRRWAYNVKELDYVIYMVSVEHDKCPDVNGNVRAHTYISGYAIKKHPTDPNSCLLMIVSQVDIKGLVPKFIVNSIAASGPSGWGLS